MPEALDTMTRSTAPNPNYPARCAQLWVEPHTLPKYGDVSQIRGNAPEYIKQLNNNTFGAYAIGGADCFAHSIGKAINFVEIDLFERRDGNVGSESLEVKTVAELCVTKGSGSTSARNSFWI